MIFFESQKVYDYGEMFVEQGVPEGYYEIELGEPSVKRAGHGPDADHARARAVHGRRGGRRTGEARHFGRSDRPPRDRPAELRAARGIGAEDREGAAGLSDAVERGSVMQTRRVEPDAALLRRSGRAAGSDRIAQLDHAGGGVGGAVLPAGVVGAGRDPRADPAAEGVPAEDESVTP